MAPRLGLPVFTEPAGLKHLLQVYPSKSEHKNLSQELVLTVVAAPVSSGSSPPPDVCTSSP